MIQDMLSTVINPIYPKKIPIENNNFELIHS